MIESMRDLENVQILVITSDRVVKALPRATTLRDHITAGDTVFLHDGSNLVMCKITGDHKLKELNPYTSAKVWTEIVEANPWVSAWAGGDPRSIPPKSA